jgi:negative regulator of replication initiation
VFTITIQDEGVYRMLVERASQQGNSIDDVLRALLEQQPEPRTESEITPALKLLALIDAADLRFDHPFDARDAGEILSSEAGAITWRAAQGDDGAP